MRDLGRPFGAALFIFSPRNITDRQKILLTGTILHRQSSANKALDWEI